MGAIFVESFNANTSLSTEWIESAEGFGSNARALESMVSKEAGTALAWGAPDTGPPELGRCISAAGFLAGGTVLPPQ